MSTPPAIGGDEGDSEDWLITYADAITLLMAFFVMMFSISEVSDEKYEEVAGGILSEIIGKDCGNRATVQDDSAEPDAEPRRGRRQDGGRGHAPRHDLQLR